MQLKKIGCAAVTAVTLSTAVIASVTPAAAWCRWGGCGWGWRGPVAAGVVAGAIVGGAVVAATAGPRPYAQGGRFVCPPGYHWGPQGRACWSD